MGSRECVSRRCFVAGAVSCAATAALAAGSVGPQAHFPTEPRDRLAVASYPFRAWIAAPHNHDYAGDGPRLDGRGGPGMDLAAFARFVRSTFDVRHIEPLDNHFASTEPDDVKALRRELGAAGVTVVNIPVDEPVELCCVDAATRAKSNARYARWIDIARTLGSPSVRMSLPKCRDVADLQRAVDAIRPTIEYAASQNVVVNLENDDPVLASDARLIAAIKLAATPWLRALPDFANSLMGGDEHFNHRAVKGMFAHAWNIAHVKDAEMIDGQRRTVSLPELFLLAKQSGYRGYYSMESDSNADPVPDTKHLIQESLRLM